MKVSVSLPAEDVSFLDAYTRGRGMPSRSATVHEAVRCLRDATESESLSRDYEAAWSPWAAGGDAAGWESTAGDGLGS